MIGEDAFRGFNDLLMQYKQATGTYSLSDAQAQADADVERFRERLMNYDFSLPPMKAETLAKPSGLEGILAAFAGPQASQQFIDRVGQINRFNAQAEMAAAEAQRDDISKALAAKFGVDLEQFREALSLQSLLRREAINAQFKSQYGDMTASEKRSAFLTYLQTISGPDGQQIIDSDVNDPEQLNMMRSFLNLPATASKARVRMGMMNALSKYSRDEAQQEKGLQQRDRSLEQADIREQRLQIAQNQAFLLDDTQAAQKATEVRKEINDIETAITEIKDKLSPSTFGKWIRRMRGVSTEEFSESEKNELKRLKSISVGKQRFSLDQLETEYQFLNDMLSFYFDRFPGIRDLMRQPQQQSGGGATPGNSNVGGMSEEEILKALGSR